ncbi:hypothetical protein ACSBR2_007939 [Camellia fascicularis]
MFKDINVGLPGLLTRKLSLGILSKGIWCSRKTELPSITLGASSDPIRLALTSSNQSGRVELSFLWISMA